MSHSRAFSFGMRKIVGFSPIRHVLHRTRRRRLVILTYHGIQPKSLPVHNWCQMPAVEFAKQMEFLAANYTPLPLSEVVRRLAAHQTLPENSACVTFDDGFRNVLTTALPVLERHHIPFTVFVITGLAESGLPPWPEQVLQALIYSKEPAIEFEEESLLLGSAVDREKAFYRIVRVLKGLKSNERQSIQNTLIPRISGDHLAPPIDSPFATLRWQEIDQLEQTGLTEFGSHTHDHEILTNCTPDEQLKQLQDSRSILLDRLGYCKVLAYPNGNYSEEILQLTRSAGYEAAVSVRQMLNRMDVDLFAMGRIDIGAGWSMDRFETGLLGY